MNEREIIKTIALMAIAFHIVGFFLSLFCGEIGIAFWLSYSACLWLFIYYLIYRYEKYKRL